MFSGCFYSSVQTGCLSQSSTEKRRENLFTMNSPLGAERNYFLAVNY